MRQERAAPLSPSTFSRLPKRILWSMVSETALKQTITELKWKANKKKLKCKIKN